MDRFFVRFLLTGALLSLLVSCKDPGRYKHELQVLDTLSAQLNALHQLIRQNDSAYNRSRIRSCEERMAAADRLLPDTIYDTGLAGLLMAYADACRLLRLCADTLADYSRSLSESRGRIAGLQNDLKKDIADEKKAKEYVLQEKQIAENIVNSLKVLLSTREESMRKFDSLDPLVVRESARLDSIASMKK